MRLLGICDGSSFSGLVGIKTRPEVGRGGSITSLNPHNSSVGRYCYSLHSTVEETKMPNVGQLAKG